MGITEQQIKQNYPLHSCVWDDDAEELERLIGTILPQDSTSIEKVDPRGRTPLMLAVKLGHAESVGILLKHEANVHFEHSSGWTVVNEAVCLGNPEVLELVLKAREQQRRKDRSRLIPQLLRRLSNAPDFYVEMKWDFSSWVPLVSRMCPTNTHKVYKMGSCLRVDSSGNGPTEGRENTLGLSVIFQGKGDHVRIIEVDHNLAQVFVSEITSEADSVLLDPIGIQSTISQRLSNPVMLTYVNLEKITFERNKTGIWGWGSDKNEKVGEYDCKVFAASNVELITKMRYEHLAESDKNQSQQSTNLQKILNMLGTDVEETETIPPGAARPITKEEYFDETVDLNKSDIGRPIEQKMKVNKFKAKVWLSEEYPLNLQEQLMPIIDIMALSSPQFSKLKDFIQLQIPAGFPVKIEIPLFHLVNTCTTFCNIFGMETSVPGVSTIEEAEGRVTCVLEEDLFEPPMHYIRRSAGSALMSATEDDMFLWNPDESEQIDIYQALNAPRPVPGFMDVAASEDERLLQRAIEESLRSSQFGADLILPPAAAAIENRGNGSELSQPQLPRTDSAEELQMILELSRREEEEKRQRLLDEEETLSKVLQLSLQEK